MTTIALTVHDSGIIGEPLHLQGEGSTDCLSCQPVTYPAMLLLARDRATDAAIARIADRLAVLEQVLSDSIPEQAWETYEK